MKAVRVHKCGGPPSVKRMKEELGTEPVPNLQERGDFLSWS